MARANLGPRFRKYVARDKWNPQLPTFLPACLPAIFALSQLAEILKNIGPKTSTMAASARALVDTHWTIESRAWQPGTSDLG